MGNDKEIQFISFEGQMGDKIIIKINDIKSIRNDGDCTVIKTYDGELYKSRIRTNWFAEKLSSISISI